MSRKNGRIREDSGEGPGSLITLSEIVPEDHKLFHVFNFIEENYGKDPRNILHALKNILDFDKGVRSLIRTRKNFTFKSAFDALKYTLPATVYGAELGLKIHKYVKDLRQEEMSEWQKKDLRIKELLKLREGEGNDKFGLNYINDDILLWLLKAPKTNGYKILGYYTNPALEKLEVLPNELESVCILVERNEKRFIFTITVKKFSSMSFIAETYTISGYSDMKDSVLKELEMLILKDFIMTFDISKNILEFRGGLISKKRAKVDEVINQYDINPLVKEIKRVLSHGRKRGYGFIGRQGTGKSIIIKKLEEILTDTIILKITPEEFMTSSCIKHCFNLIKTVQPVLVIIEDMDAYNFRDKNERVGTFINEIDDSNNDLNAVFLVTINDPDMIHRTIIDRPGRFDQIIEIKSPQSTEEVYEVMKSKYDKLIHFYEAFEGHTFYEMKDIHPTLLTRCLDNRFTQAELTSGIIEKIFLNCEDPEKMDFNKELEKAIESFEESKQTLKDYSFNEEEAEPEDDRPDLPIAEKTMPVTTAGSL